jgi:hypothetical protein
MGKTLFFRGRQGEGTSQTRSRHCLEIIRCIALTAVRDMLPASLFALGAATPCSRRNGQCFKKSGAVSGQREYRGAAVR